MSLPFPPDPSRPPAAGTMIGERYRLIKLLDEGAMGRVYLGEHIHMRKRVAIKVLRRELTQVPEVLARFEREAMAAAHIEHPNVAAATDFGKLQDGSVYLILEYVEGRTLRAEIKKGPLGVVRSLRIARQVAAGLAAAHDLNIVHRDLKPENVMLVQLPGGQDLVKVLDFGVAKVPIDMAGTPGAETGSAITKAGMVFGTPDYMAPEQALGQTVDSRADLYSLGVILFEMLTGIRPFVSNQELGILGQQLSSGAPSMKARAPKAIVPKEVEQLVASLLVNEATERQGPALLLVKRLAQELSILGEEVDVLPLPLGEASVAHHGEQGFDDDPAGLKATAPAPPRLSGRVMSALPRVMRNVPTWAVVALPVVALGGLAGLLIGLGTPSPSPAGGVAPASTVEAAPGVKLSKASSEQIAEAARAGALAIAALQQRFPKDGNIVIAQARAYQKLSQHQAGFDAISAAFALDKGVLQSAHFKSSLWFAAQHRETEKAAFSWLKRELGDVGADIVFDLAVTKGVRSSLKQKAKAWLKTKRFQRISTPAASVAAALLLADTCPTRSSLVKRAENVGDQRSVKLLRLFLSGKGCAVATEEPCNSCLDAKAVQASIEAIGRRVPATSAATD